MSLKETINQALGQLGYSIVRKDTLDKLTASPPAGAVAPPERPSAEATPTAVATSKRRLTLRPVSNRPPRICNGYADKSASEKLSGWVAEKVAEFHANGIAVLETDPDQARRWADSESFERDVSNLHSSWDWAGNAVQLPKGSGVFAGMPSETLLAGIEKILTSQEYEAFFRGVLGCDIDVGNCRLVRSPPHKGSGTGPQSWHEDGCPAGIIRGVLYLTDVDEESGPFQYKDAARDEHTVMGKVGNLLVFDAMRLPHRAMPPISRERRAIDLVFMPRQPGQKFRIISAGMNHWPSDPFFFTPPTDKSEFRKLQP